MVTNNHDGNALERTNAAIEALRRGQAPDLKSFHGQDYLDVAVVPMATRLALGGGRALPLRAGFGARLERKLLARQAVLLGRGAGQRRALLPEWARPGRRTGLGLALVVTVIAALFAVRGPRQALADVRRLLSYVPGLGFVATRDARVLAEPVEITRQGVTMRVEQVIADARETKIVVAIEAPGIAPDRGAMTHVPDADIVLHTAVGNKAPLTEWSQSPEGAVLTFGPLPADADSALLTMRVPPGLPAGAVAQGEWAFRLCLGRQDDAIADTGILAPYDPAVPVQEYHGIGLRVLDVAHTAEETVVRVGMDGYPHAEAGMPPHLGGRFLPTLRDNAGRSYRAGPAPGAGFEAGALVAPAPEETPVADGPTMTEEVLAFEPLHPEARELMLTVDGVHVEVPADGHLQVDLGDAPQIGDVFPVDVEVQVAGATVRLTGATLVEEELPLRDGVLVRTLLQFDAEQVTPRDEVIVNSLTLAGDKDVVRGSSSHGGPEGIYSVGVEFRDGHIPTGVLTLSVERAGVIYLGPWELTWEVPPGARP